MRVCSKESFEDFFRWSLLHLRFFACCRIATVTRTLCSQYQVFLQRFQWNSGFSCWNHSQCRLCSPFLLDAILQNNVSWMFQSCVVPGFGFLSKTGVGRHHQSQMFVMSWFVESHVEHCVLGAGCYHLKSKPWTLQPCRFITENQTPKLCVMK